MIVPLEEDDMQIDSNNQNELQLPNQLPLTASEGPKSELPGFLKAEFNGDKEDEHDPENDVALYFQKGMNVF